MGKWAIKCSAFSYSERRERGRQRGRKKKKRTSPHIPIPPSLHHPLFILTMSAVPQQELPRPGGFPEIRYKRYVPKIGPSGLALFSGITIMCTLGLYRTGQGNLERR
jgi:hypothetical protein